MKEQLIDMPRIIPPNGWRIVESPKTAILYEENGKWYLKSDPVVFAENVIAHENKAEEKLAPCPFCKKPRGKDEIGAYICPCPHCGDEVPF